MIPHKKIRGITLIEVLVVVAISGMLMVSLSNVVSGALNVTEVSGSKNDLNREAGFILDQIIHVVSRSPQIEPIVPGIAFTAKLDPERDSDMDNYPDADNDKDGEIDEGPANQDWEDWVVYKKVVGTDNLIVEDPFPLDVTGDSFVTAGDTRQYLISENVSAIIGTLTQDSAKRFDLLKIDLELTGSNGDTVSRSVTIRVGGAL